MGVKRTPTVFINGRLLEAEVDPETVRLAIEAQLPAAKLLASQGIGPQQIYWEIVKTGKSALPGAAPPMPAPPDAGSDGGDAPGIPAPGVIEPGRNALVPSPNTPI